MRISWAVTAFAIATLPMPSPSSARTEPNSEVLAQEARALQSPEYLHTCMSEDSPLDASRYDCLDSEFRRLETMLTREYNAALERQPDEAARQGVERSERQ